MEGITYDVRIEKMYVYSGKEVTTYYVRWRVGDQRWKEPFRIKAQALSFEAEIRAAAKKAQAFSLMTGRPSGWHRNTNDMSWYDHCCSYVDMKWKDASAKHRHDIARALRAGTPAMFSTERGKPDDADIRKALWRWGFNTKQRDECPADLARTLEWVARNTVSVSRLADPALTRKLLDQATTNIDGKRAAPSTVRRHRAILHNALEYAVERRTLAKNPITDLKWKAPQVARTVDRRCVINHEQAKRLLAAVRAQEPSGPILVTFYAAMYYCGLRPEEAAWLAEENVTLPALVLNKETGELEDPSYHDDWGELHFRVAAPEVPGDWTDDGSNRDERQQLKHRARGRNVECPVRPS